MRYTVQDFTAVKQLLDEGRTVFEVAAKLGIPRATVRRWSLRSAPPETALRPVAASWSVGDAPAYCYLLGVYLGDGHLTHRPPNGWTLRVFCDERYSEVIEEILEAMAITFPGAIPRNVKASPRRCDILSISHIAVARAFPQHGPGRKHMRPIVLADWQLELTHAHPGELVRGLIHSDGCRSINHVRTTLPTGRVADYHYVRYFFTNHSADIRQIFIDHCGLLGVRVTQPNHRNLSISHRASVAVLEEMVGEKR
jgi:hypothetical protein